MAPEGSSNIPERVAEKVDKTIREINTIVSGVLSEKYSDRKITLTTLVSSVASKFEPVGKAEGRGTNANLYDEQQQIKIIGRTIWSYLIKSEYKGRPMDLEAFREHMLKVGEDEQAYMASFLDIYDALYLEALKRM